MNRFVSMIVVVAVFTWIVPLGAFIQAAQERQICNGRRAVCLCSSYRSRSDRIELKRLPRSTEKDLSFPSFGTNFVVLEDFDFDYIPSQILRDAKIYLRPQSPAYKPIEPVPKVFFYA